jgi:hypothetical protein
MKTLRACFLLIFVLIVVMPAKPALADVAPPEEPSGGNINPNGQTRVQMVSEKVTYDFVYQRAQDEIPWVTADFVMRNLGDVTEQMKVRFPISGDPRLLTADDGIPYEKIPLLENISVQVDGQMLPTTTYTSTGESFETFPVFPVVWATFDVTFPPGQDVTIQVMYNQPPLIYGQLHYSYVLETGSGWFGSIEKAEFFVRMPYLITKENCPDCFAQDAGWTITDNTLYRTWSNLEPTVHDNVYFSIVTPSVWQTILQAREVLTEKPNDYEMVLALARACRQAAKVNRKGQYRDDEGGQQLVQCTLDTFLEAVRLNPKSIDLRKEFLYALDWMSEFDWGENWNELVKQQVIGILSVDPLDQDALYIAKEWLKMSPDELPPTYTPIATYTPDPRTPTEVLPPTPKPILTRTPYPTMKRYPTHTITPTRTRRPTRTSTSLPSTNTFTPTILPTSLLLDTATPVRITPTVAALDASQPGNGLFVGVIVMLTVGVGLSIALARKKQKPGR